MNKKTIRIIMTLGGFCCLGLIQLSKNYITNPKGGFFFNLVCLAAALILLSFGLKGSSKKDSKKEKRE